MQTRFPLLLLTLCSTGFSATATFEGPISSGPQYTEAGILFRPVDALVELFAGGTFSPNGTGALLVHPPRTRPPGDEEWSGLIRAEVPQDTRSVSVDLGDYGSEPLLLRLLLYD